MLAFHLVALASYTHQFWHSIRLMDHCESLDDFGKDFPYAVEVRHAAAHVADRMFKAADVEKHCLENGGVYAGTVWHRALIFTSKKGIVGLDVNEKSLDNLFALKRRVYAAFKNFPVLKPER